MVRSEGLEPPTPWFEAKYSIQLSYERMLDIGFHGLEANGVVSLFMMVGRVGVEPTTQRLKASCSTN